MKMKGYNKSGGMPKGVDSKKGNDKYMSGGMNLKDNTQASQVRSVKVPQCQGWSEVKPYRSGNRGYPSEAFNYDY